MTYQKLLNCIASNVKREREKTLLSVRGFADELDIANTTLYYLEGGVTNPKVETLYRISEYTGIPLEELFRDHSAEQFRDLYDIVGTLRKYAADLTAMADRLDDALKDRLL